MSGFRFTIPALKFDGSYPAAPIVVIPDKQLNKQVAPSVLKARFGDGYVQVLPDGINPIQEQIFIAFVKRTREDIDDIVSFFEVLAASEPFTLTLSDHREGISAPNEKTIRVLCTTWNNSWDYDEYYSCSATLERYYGPV